jgi:hypothetical protein
MGGATLTLATTFHDQTRDTEIGFTTASNFLLKAEASRQPKNLYELSPEAEAGTAAGMRTGVAGRYGVYLGHQLAISTLVASFKMFAKLKRFKLLRHY